MNEAPGPISGGNPVESAAIELVVRFERDAGRHPRDTRKVRGAAADIESDDRIIGLEHNCGYPTIDHRNAPHTLGITRYHPQDFGTVKLLIARESQLSLDLDTTELAG